VPVTPFHFGPGLFGKALLPRWWSWTAFCASNVAIDVEPLYYMTRGEPPLHRQLHTFLGAGLAGLAVAIVLVAMSRIPPLRAWFASRSPALRAEGTPLGIAVGALAGALSHPVLDGIMHHDIEPFAPWTAANPLQGLIGLRALHLACVAAGLIGFAILIRQSTRSTSAQTGL